MRVLERHDKPRTVINKRKQLARTASNFEYAFTRLTGRTQQSHSYLVVELYARTGLAGIRISSLC
jgi:hypothetical protein